MSNFFLFGKEIKKTFYKKEQNEFVKLSSSENFYKHDERLDKKIIGYNIRSNANIITNDNLAVKMSTFDVTSFSKSRQWYYLDKVVNMEFFNGLQDTLITTTKNYYDNINHLQKTKIVKTLNSNDSLITRIRYANDLNYEPLIAENRVVEPLEVFNYRNNTILSKQKTIYNSFTDDNTLPEYIQTAKGTGLLENRIVYHRYDNRGNPIEISKKDGTFITYLWGYNKEYPIAKIENATYLQVLSVIELLPTAYNSIEKIQTTTNDDDDRDVDDFDTSGNRIYVGNEGKVRQALDLLRLNLSSAQVTSYTYDPLVGVTSMTDSRGYTIYYEYDEFNRLQRTKDADSNILSENKYHYKN